MKKFLTIIVIICLFVVGMIGCGPENSDETKKTDVNTSKTEVLKTDLKEPNKPTKVALCVTGTVNDGGWCQTAYDGLLEAKKDYNIDISYTENVQTTEMESAFTDYAAQDYEIIIGLGYQFGDPALSVAKKYPNANFIILEGSVDAENVKSCKISNEQSRYLLGYIAANISETGVVGFVAGVEQASITKVAEAFKLGALAANPDVKVHLAYTGSFTDIALAKEAALAMIDSGADVIGHGANTGGNGVIAACQERDVWAMGAAADQNYLAPDTVVVSDVYSYGDVLQYLIEQHETEGKIPMETENYGFKQGIVKLSPYYNNVVSKELAEEVDELIEKIKTGELVVPVIETPSDQ